MDPVVPGAPWLLALAGLVSGVACLAVWRRVPWQARQTALLQPSSDRRTRTLLGVESWSMAAGVALLCLAM